MKFQQYEVSQSKTMNESLNWNGSNAQFNAGFNRKHEQERRKAELMAHMSSTRDTQMHSARKREVDWAGTEITYSQRRHVESKNRDSLSDIMSSSSSSDTTHVTSSRKKQFSRSEPLEINLTGPGGRTRNNASSWKTSSQIHQSGMKTDVGPKSFDRRTSRGSVSTTATRLPRRPEPKPTSSFSMFDTSMLDAIASRTSRMPFEESSQKQDHKPLPGYTGKRRGIQNPKHHDKSVSVGFHPYGSSYSGLKTKF